MFSDQSSNVMYKNVEIRKLPVGILTNIVDILEINQDWKKFMSSIPRDLDNATSAPKYNNEHIRLVEEYAKYTRRKCAEILFDEWGTSGRLRPTLSILRDLLHKVEMYRAVDAISFIMKEPSPLRPEIGPAASIDTDITSLLNDESMEQKMNSMASIVTDDFSNTVTGAYEQILCNGTTAQMKSASDMMKFSTDIQDKSIPIVDVQLPYVKQEPTPLVSNENSNFNNCSMSTLKSQDLPNFEILIPKSGAVDNVTNQQSTMSLSTEGDDSSQIISTGNQSHLPLPNIFASAINNDILEDNNLIQFEYKELENITNKFQEWFSNEPCGPVGKIGSGGFGEVFVGTHSRYGNLAIKKIRKYLQLECEPEVAIGLFNNEVSTLSLLHHENIVPILGFSIDGISPCIVCKYIDGGSLEQKIAEKVLSEHQRMTIMLGTAKGLLYIHNTEKPVHSTVTDSDSVPYTKRTYFLHGDIKSANILLTKDYIPKLCDFGLAKQYNSTMITRSMMGTSAYMAPEGFSGTISQTNDIFSYGIVLLELLTGLKPIITENSGSINIKNYIEENCTNDNLSEFLDPVVGKWTYGQQIYNLAKTCLEHQRSKRPSIDIVCQALNQLFLE